MRSDQSLKLSLATSWQRLVFGGLLVVSAATGCSETTEEGTNKDDEELESDDDSATSDEGATAREDGGRTRRDASSTVDEEEESDAGASRGDAGKRDGGAVRADAGGASGDAALWCSVKAITDKSCATCHDGKGTGGSPMGLVKHADFLADNPSTPGTKVYEAVGERVHDAKRPMPPRGLLPAADLKVIDQWIAAGAPEGDDASCGGGGGKPSNPSVTDGWDPSKCDAVYEIRSHAPNSTGPYMVPAGDEYHPQVAVPAPWGNERVQAIAFRPITDNAKVLHHWILYGGSGLGAAFLTGWAPGDDVRPPYPDDVGMDMPNTLRLDMHYYNKGPGAKPEPDASGLEICVLKGKNVRPKTAAVSMGLMSIGSGGVLAPRGANMTPQTGTCRVQTTEPVHIMTAAPHAHKYARRMKFVVKKKDGKEIVMHDAPFLFGEQGTYAVPGGEVIVETGDTITTTCYYTNETNNNIRFGESTESEMCFNFAAYWPKGALRCSGGLNGGTPLGF